MGPQACHTCCMFQICRSFLICYPLPGKEEHCSFQSYRQRYRSVQGRIRNSNQESLVQNKNDGKAGIIYLFFRYSSLLFNVFTPFNYLFHVQLVIQFTLKKSSPSHFNPYLLFLRPLLATFKTFMLLRIFWPSSYSILTLTYVFEASSSMC